MDTSESQAIVAPRPRFRSWTPDRGKLTKVDFAVFPALAIWLRIRLWQMGGGWRTLKR